MSISPNNGPLFILDARKLLTPETIARIETRFHLPAERTKVQSDFHYQSITIMLASIDRGRGRRTDIDAFGEKSRVVIQRRTAMAKGQQGGNREAKKPKKEKP